MPQTRLQVDITLQGDKFEVVGAIVDPSFCPKDIFLYANTGEASLGSYMGVADLDEYGTRPLWNGGPMPTFGAKYVKHTECRVLFPTLAAAQAFETNLRADIERAHNAFLSAPSFSNVYTIGEP